MTPGKHVLFQINYKILCKKQKGTSGSSSPPHSDKIQIYRDPLEGFSR